MVLQCPLIHMLDSRLTGEDEDVGEGGVKKQPEPPHPRPIIIKHVQMITPLPSDYGA